MVGRGVQERRPFNCLVAVNNSPHPVTILIVNAPTTFLQLYHPLQKLLNQLHLMFQRKPLPLHFLNQLCQNWALLPS